LEILANASGSTGKSGYQVPIDIGPHQLLSDEPEALGGDDAGPDPYSLVLSGLVACTAITLKMYAARKGWPLENAEVHCRLIKTDAAMRPEIERSILLKGSLDDEQKQRLLQIANACPVHKLLSAENSIRSNLVN
jgi:putative redox protein